MIPWREEILNYKGKTEYKPRNCIFLLEAIPRQYLTDAAKERWKVEWAQNRILPWNVDPTSKLCCVLNPLIYRSIFFIYFGTITCFSVWYGYPAVTKASLFLRTILMNDHVKSTLRVPSFHATFLLMWICIGAKGSNCFSSPLPSTISLKYQHRRFIQALLSFVQGWCHHC